MAARAALLLPLFVFVFGDEPPPAGESASAAWGWVVSVKVLMLLYFKREINDEGKYKNFRVNCVFCLQPTTAASLLCFSLEPLPLGGTICPVNILRT